jgi:hypothetical protein
MDEMRAARSTCGTWPLWRSFIIRAQIYTGLVATRH